MQGRAVPLVPIKSVLWLQTMHKTHPAVPKHLRYNGGAGDVQTFGVPVHHGKRRHGTPRGNPLSIYQEETGPGEQAVDRLAHRRFGGWADADSVNLFRPYRTDADTGNV